MNFIKNETQKKLPLLFVVCFTFFFLTNFSLFSLKSTFCQAKTEKQKEVQETKEKSTKIITQSLAQVGNQIITSREVLISGVVDQWFLIKDRLKSGLNPQEDIDKKSWILNIPSEAFQKQLNQVIIEHLASQEAQSFSVGQVSLDSVNELVRQLQENTKSWSEWKKLEISERELFDGLQRKLTSKNFLKYKIESAGVQISETEARNYYLKNKVKFGNLAFENFQENIKELLAQQQLESKLKDWLEVLKRKYKVRLLESTDPS